MYCFILGVQHLVYGCYDKDSNEKVDEENCKHIGSKDVEDVECTMIDCSSML